MKRWLLLCLATVSLCACQGGPAPTSGGGGNNKNLLISAKLDTLPILQSDPEYQKLSQDYVKQQIQLRQKIGIQVKEGKLAQEEAGPAYLREQEKLNKKWMAATNDFIQTRHAKMRNVVKQLCEEKGIDIVLIDSKAYPTVEYGALDITQDVLMKIFGNPIAPSPTAGGTP